MQAILEIAEIDPVCFALTKAKQVLDPNYRNNLLGEQTVHGKFFLKIETKGYEERRIESCLGKVTNDSPSRMPSVT